MPSTHKSGPTCHTTAPSLDPGTLNLQPSLRPGPISATQYNQTIAAEDAHLYGSIPVSLSAGALLRGTNGLAAELTPLASDHDPAPPTFSSRTSPANAT